MSDDQPNPLTEEAKRAATYGAFAFLPEREQSRAVAFALVDLDPNFEAKIECGDCEELLDNPAEAWVHRKQEHEEE